MSGFALIGELAGGVGLFLLGMGLMTDGLKLAAGPALERTLARSTKTRLRGLASGALVTILVQSSSATTLTTIGFVSWVALAYAFKWAWAPLVDRMPLPWLTARLGRRRSWLLASQLLVAAGLVGMALTDPAVDLRLLVVFALLTALASATQDIALDAYRIESAAVQKQAALAAAYQTGYRLAMIWAGAGALAIAARFDPSEAEYHFAPWTFAYLAMAASMAVGVAVTLLLHPSELDQGRGACANVRDMHASTLSDGLALGPDLANPSVCDAD